MRVITKKSYKLSKRDKKLLSKMSYRQIADRLGISCSFVWDIINDYRYIPDFRGKDFRELLDELKTEDTKNGKRHQNYGKSQ